MKKSKIKKLNLKNLPEIDEKDKTYSKSKPSSKNKNSVLEKIHELCDTSDLFDDLIDEDPE